MIDTTPIKKLNLKVAIVTDDIVASLYGQALQKELEAHLFVFPHGERNKTRQTKEMIEDQMFEAKLGKDTCLVGLGGGIVTDLSGFIASTYARGIPLILIPTTLMGMVDASIGGKNGVNTPFGKNLIGTTYQPKDVIIEPSFLKTLPEVEFKQGLVEMIKHGLIHDHNYFLDLHNITDLKESISKSIEIKKKFIAEKKRDILNFGHTVGHALEKASHYSLRHGEAVSMGLVAECQLSKELGVLDQHSLNQIIDLLKKYQLPTTLPDIDPHTLIKNMALDKKSLQGQPRFTILKKIGEVHSFNTPVHESILLKSLC